MKKYNSHFDALISNLEIDPTIIDQHPKSKEALIILLSLIKKHRTDSDSVLDDWECWFGDIVFQEVN